MKYFCYKIIEWTFWCCPLLFVLFLNPPPPPTILFSWPFDPLFLVPEELLVPSLFIFEDAAVDILIVILKIQEKIGKIHKGEGDTLPGGFTLRCGKLKVLPNHKCWCWVHCSFSLYKNLLTDKLQSFTEEN